MPAAWCSMTDAFTTMNESPPVSADIGQVLEQAPPDVRQRRESSIVPLDSIAARALLAVVAIMTFLASLTVGGVVLVADAAGEWQAAVAREVTIQIRPATGRDGEADVAAAAALA